MKDWDGEKGLGKISWGEFEAPQEAKKLARTWILQLRPL